MTGVLAAVAIAAGLACAAGSAYIATRDDSIEMAGDYGMLGFAALAGLAAVALSVVAVGYPASAVAIQTAMRVPGSLGVVMMAFTVIVIPVMFYVAWRWRDVPGHILNCVTGSCLMLAMTSVLALYAG